MQPPRHLIIHEAAEDAVAASLRAALQRRGDDVESVGFSDANTPRGPFTSLLTILPRYPGTIADESLRLRRIVERLQFVISLTNSSQEVTFVQFGGGRFGAGTEPAHPEQCCTTALARTLHLERPELRVRVIDFANTMVPDQIADLVVNELGGPAFLSTVGYTAEGQRLVPQARLQQPADYVTRSFEWTNNDVILVTGGGKGITAECALALGQETKARIVLVGSTPSPDREGGVNANSSELERTLARFDAADLNYRYFPCNLTQVEAVRNLIERVRTELGPITAVVHGAGVNRIRHLGDSGTDDVFAEVAPKLLGAHHLCAALANAPPKLFIGLTSIIGVTGMPGNGWYAFSNEALDLVLRNFECRHGTAVLSIAFSIWGETGMGARTGSVERLRQYGIEAIPTAEGVRRFLQLFWRDPGHRQIVVTARLAGFDTWPAPPLPIRADLRFVEHIVTGQPELELVARTRLTLQRDPYLEDHALNGSLLFPTVFGLEAMAQATATLIGEANPAIVRIEDIRLDRPIVVDASCGTEIEIRAVAEETETNGERHVRVGIRTEQTGFAVDHFAATMVLGTPRLGPRVELPDCAKAVPIEPRSELYGSLLFQGPRFQRIESILELDNDHAIVEAQSSPTSFLLGDPFFRDVLLQIGQLTIPRQFCLPIRIERLERFAPPRQSAARKLVFAPSKVRHGNEYVADIFTTDEHGNVLEKLTGYWLRVISERPAYPLAAELAEIETRDEERLRSILDCALPSKARQQIGVALGRMRAHSLPRPVRHLQLRPIFDRAMRARFQTDQTAILNWSSTGKPYIENTAATGLDVSIAHDDTTCLCVVGGGPVGCDWLPIQTRSREDWRGLLSDARMPLLDALVEAGDSTDVAGSRIWCAIEAVRKATQAGDVELTLARRRQDVVFLRAVNLPAMPLVFTQPAQLTCPPPRMIALVVAGLEPEAEPVIEGINPAWHCVSVTEDGPQGQPVQQMRFLVSFQEASGLTRRVPVSRYQFWMGKMRELVTSSQVPQLVAQIATGKWGLVTNWADVRMLGEATANDVIQMRFWTMPARGAEVEFCCDFWKMLPGDQFERLAFARQKATWVRLVGHGHVAPEDLPVYLAEYIERMGPRTALANGLPVLPESLAFLQRPTAAPSIERLGSPVLIRDTIQTSSVEANLVGNIYFANYFAWQERLRDLFLHRVAPEFCRGAGPPGEWLGLHGRVDYLREAMPFDRIEVTLSARSIEDNRTALGFEYFKLLPNGALEKLSVGRQEVVWIERDAKGVPSVKPIPTVIRQALAAGDRILARTASRNRHIIVPEENIAH
jgi:enediyne polyketide synthase